MYGEKNTLCIHCKNAVPNLEDRGCSWSRCGEPVEGWEATPTKIDNTRSQSDKYRYVIDSFEVHSCPLFESDGSENRKLIKDVDQKPKPKPRRFEYHGENYAKDYYQDHKKELSERAAERARKKREAYNASLRRSENEAD